MNILVITGCCLQENSSANLSHAAYINGMTRLGNDVDLLCASHKGVSVDNSICMPEVNALFEYDGTSLYEKISGSRNRDKSDAAVSEGLSASPKVGNSNKTSFGQKMVSGVKKTLRSMYGIYNPSIVWFYRAKKFRPKKNYDIVVSMAYPPVSHKLAGYMIKNKIVRPKKWIQLWEDPWAEDLGNKDDYNKSKRAEAKLLDEAWDIVYVSPLTMINQQGIFPNNKSKMRWVPLSVYYDNNSVKYSQNKNRYGYFGEYNPHVRNLRPFYEAAKSAGINVDICGSPFGLFEGTDKISISPRLPVQELRHHEDNVNVIICLFNLGGGQIPGKIYQYAASNKIILAILDGSEDEKRLIKEYYSRYNRFIFCENTVESIKTAINNIENGNFGNVKNEAIDDFLSEKVAKQLLG